MDDRFIIKEWVGMSIGHCEVEMFLVEIEVTYFKISPSIESILLSSLQWSYLLSRCRKQSVGDMLKSFLKDVKSFIPISIFWFFSEYPTRMNRPGF